MIIPHTPLLRLEREKKPLKCAEHQIIFNLHIHGTWVICLKVNCIG